MDERYFIETKRSYSGIVLFAIYIVIFSFFKHENFNYSSWYPMVLITNICFLLLTNYKKFVNNLSNAAFTLFMMSIISIDIIAIIFALNSISITFSPFQIGSFTIRNDEFHLIWLVLFISKSLYFLYVVYEDFLIGKQILNINKFKNEIADLKLLHNRFLLSKQDFENSKNQKIINFCASKIKLSENYDTLKDSFKRNIITEVAFRESKQRLIDKEIVEIKNQLNTPE